MKKNKLIKLSIILLFTLCILWGCKKTPKPKPLEPVIESYLTLDESSLKESYYIDEFAINDIYVFFYEGDVLKERIMLLPTMLKEPLNLIIGVNEINIKWYDRELKFNINCIAKEFYTQGLSFSLNQNSNTYTVVSYNGVDKDVVIPSTYNKLPVTEIKNNCFRGNETIEKVTLPNTIKRIGDYAFFECYNLKDINIPSSVETIGQVAFFDSLANTSVYLTKSVESIGSRAFNLVNKFYLEDQEINPKWDEDFKDSESSVCYFGLKESDVHIYEHMEYLIVDNEIIITGLDTLEEITINIPSTIDGIKVTKIGEFAFRKLENLKGVTLESIEVISKYAFSETSVDTLICPATLKEIGEQAFANTKTLSKVEFNEGLVIIKHSAFSACENIATLLFPTTLEVIEGYAFQNCYYIASAYIHTTTKVIGEFAFYANQKITIYYEGEAIPSTWHSNFNPSNRPVVLNHSF